MQVIAENLKVRFIGLFLLYSVITTKSKEEHSMKAIVMKDRNYIPYPGAATRKQQLHHFLDKCLLVASALGIVAALMFLAVIV